MDINSAVGRKAGLTDDKLHAVLTEDRRPFSETELLAIELADAMAATPANISEELFARLKQQFADEQLLELSAQIAFENFRARLNRVFDVESDHVYS